MNLENYTKEEHEGGSITFTPIKKEVKCWEDLGKIGGFYLTTNSCMRSLKMEVPAINSVRNVFATEDQCKASRAFAQLTQLMKHVNGGWVPNWKSRHTKFIIFISKGVSTRGNSYHEQRFLAFETSEIRDRFLGLHTDLINQAKPLL